MTTTNVTPRKVLLVGSLPFDNEEDAMKKAMEFVGGDNLIGLPDGEIGEKSEAYPIGTRAYWVQTIIDVCERDTDHWRVDKPVFRAKETGFPTDYEQLCRLTPKHSPSEMDQFLNFHFIDFFKSSYPIFKTLRQQQQDLQFQVGLPTGRGTTYAMMTPFQSLRYTGAFNRRMAYEANEMIQLADESDRLLFQIEVPAEFKLATLVPDFMMGLALGSIFDLVQQIQPNKADFGIHICLGDLNNKALTCQKTLDKLVVFTNKLVEGWPSNDTHPLKYIHFPLAEAKDPPPLDSAYYQPLQDIRLPDHCRFVAGFVHEKRSLLEHQQILKTIEGLRGGDGQNKVDVACSCGLGRRDCNTAVNLLKMCHTVANTNTTTVDDKHTANTTGNKPSSWESHTEGKRTMVNEQSI